MHTMNAVKAPKKKEAKRRLGGRMQQLGPARLERYLRILWDDAKARQEAEGCAGRVRKRG